MGKVRGPKRIKGGKAITLSSKITNSGQADATGVKVCLSSPKKLVKGKATTCRTIAKIAAGKSVTVKFRVVTRKARKSARAKFRLSTTWKSQGATKKNYVGHVTLIKQ
jgi:uncharacterized membrane protein